MKLTRKYAVALAIAAAGSVFFGSLPARAGGIELDKVDIVFRRNHDDAYGSGGPGTPPPPQQAHMPQPGGPGGHMPPPQPHHGYGFAGSQGGHMPPPPHHHGPRGHMPPPPRW